MSQNPINSRFYKYARRFVVSATELLVSYLREGKGIPPMTREKHRIEAEGAFSSLY